MDSLLHLDIPSDADAPGRARRAVESFAGSLGAETAADAKLLVTELITNSVKYAGSSDISLALRSDEPGHLRVEVADHGGGFAPAPRDRPATAAGGWGLHLVQTLADGWGVRDGGARVWFELQAAHGRAVAA
jgi:anti-sigma regulatory factor (Ser/Thr protein kinase)